MFSVDWADEVEHVGERAERKKLEREQREGVATGSAATSARGSVATQSSTASDDKGRGFFSWRKDKRSSTRSKETTSSVVAAAPVTTTTTTDQPRLSATSGASAPKLSPSNQGPAVPEREAFRPLKGNASLQHGLPETCSQASARPHANSVALTDSLSQRTEVSRFGLESYMAEVVRSAQGVRNPPRRRARTARTDIRRVWPQGATPPNFPQGPLPPPAPTSPTSLSYTPSFPVPAEPRPRGLTSPASSAPPTSPKFPTSPTPSSYLPSSPEVLSFGTTRARAPTAPPPPFQASWREQGLVPAPLTLSPGRADSTSFLPLPPLPQLSGLEAPPIPPMSVARLRHARQGSNMSVAIRSISSSFIQELDKHYFSRAHQTSSSRLSGGGGSGGDDGASGVSTAGEDVASPHLGAGDEEPIPLLQRAESSMSLSEGSGLTLATQRAIPLRSPARRPLPPIPIAISITTATATATATPTRPKPRPSEAPSRIGPNPTEAGEEQQQQQQRRRRQNEGEEKKVMEEEPIRSANMFEDPEGWKMAGDWTSIPATSPVETVREDVGGEERAMVTKATTTTTTTVTATIRPVDPVEADVAAMQRAFETMEMADRESILARLTQEPRKAAEAGTYRQQEIERSRWMLSALFNADPVRRHLKNSLEGGSILSLFDPEAYTSMLAALHPKATITHLAPKPLSDKLWPNVEPVVSPEATLSPFVALAPSAYDAVHCLALPALVPAHDIPALLRTISGCLKPGGTLYLSVVDPLPAAQSCPRSLRGWFEASLRINMERAFCCAAPVRMLPVWLADADMLGSARHATGTGATGRGRVMRARFDAVPMRFDPAGERVRPGDEEACAEDALRTWVGRLLWQDIWRPLITGKAWWWKSPEYVADCHEYATYFDYCLIEAVKPLADAPPSAEAAAKAPPRPRG